MRLVTYEEAGTGTIARLGAMVGDGEIIELADAFEQTAGDGRDDGAPESLLTLLRRGRPAMDTTRQALQVAESRDDIRRVKADDLTMLAPLPRPTSIRDFMLVEEHVLRGRGEVPPEWYNIPVYWKGNCDSVVGTGAEIRWPSYTEKLDYELEIAAIIGGPVPRGVSVEAAHGYIAGYTIFNDWSARDIQRREMSVGLGPGLGKDFATSMGPCFVTADGYDPVGAATQVRVNGEIWSSGEVGAMRCSFAEVIAHLAEEQELMPGDVLGSGTMAGGCGLELDRWVQPGDVVELEVEGIGILRNTIIRGVT